MLTLLSRSLSLRQPIVALALSTALISTFYLTASGINSPRLIGYDQLPPDTAQCDYDSSVGENLPEGMPQRAAMLQQRVEQTSGTAEIASRQPVRMIRDPNSSYSAVAVDTVHNE